MSSDITFRRDQPLDSVGICIRFGHSYDRAMPVCIAGMHGSGTSMVAGRLHHSGLYLGPARRLNPPSLDNPLGYWEDLQLININDGVLRAYGGSWHSPPPIGRTAADWKLSWLKFRANRRLIAFRRRQHWGWKDPRNSLTLPFWMSVIPDLKVVICVRHPGEVEQSVATRTQSARPDGLRLWRIYNERILAATTPTQRIVTHYDAHFHDSQRELRKLLDFIGIADPSRGSDPFRPEIRRYNYASAVINKATEPGVQDLYARLCAEAA